MAWTLRHTFVSEQGELLHDCVGAGSPIVLVHGTPSWSYLWRNVARLLAEKFSVYLYDLPGYGHSEKFEGQDPSIAAQARILTDLLHHWELSGVPVVGHDIGGAIALGAHILHGAPFSSIMLIDSVVTKPWITPPTQHQKRWIEAYRTMPGHIYECIARTHFATAFHRPLAREVFDRYFEPWSGPTGQMAWFQKVEAFDESYSDQIVPGFKHIKVPVRILWGEHDVWLDRNVAEAVRVAAPEGTELRIIPEAGHFSPEDDPERVAQEIAEFVN